MKIYIVNGAPGSGKTSFEKYVQYVCGEDFCKILSTVDFVKEIATQCGWNGKKTPKDRKFLSDLKRVLIEWDDVPLKRIKKQIAIIENFFWAGSDKVCIFIDCREPEEIKKFCKELNAKSLLIRRESEENKETSNKSDENVLNYDYDIIIDNNKDLRNLAWRAIDFVDEEGLRIRDDKVLIVDMLGEIKYE